jgi:hypothetical protein
MFCLIVEKIATKDEWLSFEVSQWRDAIKSRGLKLASLDTEQQKLVAEALGVSSDVTLKSLMAPPERGPSAADSPPTDKKDISGP